MFVDAAYALMVRTYAAIPGKNLIEAIDLTNETFGIEKEKQEPVDGATDAALNQLTAMRQAAR